ncbi:hypothetical protein M501DRAFT_927118 [Patellaria atrata CBS 101060]|uniref:Gem-associated protein 5 TPR domain-containing protein n=1 Tax=Patellaria atrata CBS 101060 TaxID=1346257 RepID=A0A9P4SH07_9PEZI|nr:hypothetical protein M501DRAFT_927118 [Patellaria atrata CBS 101060]
MSTGGYPRRHRSTSRTSSKREKAFLPPPAPSITPQNDEVRLEPCAATPSFFLYAQRNMIMCLHHDTLAIDRRFEGHREDVSFIYVDNVSERGSGRLVVSYDTGSTAIVWDLFTGDEIARFASYEHIRVAAWMKNGNVAFGNSQGNVILFEPQTSEHISARTIFDPITALAPSADCRTFAIGYQNGSILIAGLQPSFTILNTLTTTRAPSPINALAWHGTSSKQKSEMLAAQTLDGDLRVWSVPKAPHTDAPSIIRVLNRTEHREPGPCWFGWSKNGRIIQYTEGQTLSWDVRTKKVTFETIPTIDGVIAINNYGPTATLFTLGRNHTVQQYDVNPSSNPMLVASAQHVPANAPPSPPNSIEERKEQTTAASSKAAPVVAPALPLYLEQSSEDEGAMSPLQKIAQEMDALEEERRDRLAPLSPVSSRASSVSSRSSHGSRSRQREVNRWEKPTMSSTSSTVSGSEGTMFSSGVSLRSGHESISIRSVSSTTSSKYASSGLRKEILRSPDEAKKLEAMDLFPFVKARLSEVVFKTPSYGQQRSPDDLRRQMLSVVFGWDDDIESLIRDELSRHTPGSASGVLLSKWLGDMGADLMASMIGSESMTSSDWMLLALSSMGADSQKKVGQAFVQRLLEKGDIHPAAAILLGLGEQNDAIEVYVSQKMFMEAVLLTCLIFPTDWQRQSYLVRKWGEIAVAQGQPELAVRCFSCTSIESSEPWFSPRAQDAVYSAQKQSLLGALSPPLSPPSAGPPNRLAAKNSSLKLITNFGDKAAPQLLSTTDERTPMNVAPTPIAESALSPGGGNRAWGRDRSRGLRDPSSARTATPGAFSRRRRFPSRADTDRETLETPVPTTAINASAEIPPLPQIHTSSHHSVAESLPTLSSSVYQPSEAASIQSSALPSPAHGVFAALKEKERERSRMRGASRDRKPQGLQLDMSEEVVVAHGLPTSELSPPLTGASLQSTKVRNIDNYINSLEEANIHAKTQRAQSRHRAESQGRDGRSRSRLREPGPGDSRGRSGVRYIRPAKRSPSSPVPMSPEDVNKNKDTDTETFDDERYYQITSPTESVPKAEHRARSRSRVGRGTSKARSSSKIGDRVLSRAASRQASPVGERTRSRVRGERSGQSSPRSPAAMTDEDMTAESYDDEAIRSHARQRSRSRRPSPSRRDRSQSRRPNQRAQSTRRDRSPAESTISRRSNRGPTLRVEIDDRAGREISRKEQAARDLEQRRLSLARRPSAPAIPHPEEINARSPISVRSYTDSVTFPTISSLYSDRISRSQTVDPEAMARYGERINRSQTADPESAGRHSSRSRNMMPPIGLPATPRAMRHPRYMSSDPDERDNIPAVPLIPENLAQHNATQQASHQRTMDTDDIAPLLPSSVYGQPFTRGPARAASAPPEKMSGMQHRRGSVNSQKSHHSRKISAEINTRRMTPPAVVASIDETLADNQIIIIGDPEDEGPPPPMLAELAHLAGPPPPPPPPTMFTPGHQQVNSQGMINIAIDENRNPTPMTEIGPTPTGTPSINHRRGRGSVSDSIGGRLRSVTERMRSTSRSRSKPSLDSTHSPPAYETNLPPIPATPHVTTSPSPYETDVGLPATVYEPARRSPNYVPNSGDAIPPPPPPPPPPPANGIAPLMEQVIPPENKSFSGYRHPKEIRANMPPDYIQQGVQPGGMI